MAEGRPVYVNVYDLVRDPARLQIASLTLRRRR